MGMCSNSDEKYANAAAREAAKSFHRAKEEIHKVIVGQEDLVDSLLLCLLADGHILLEGVPGLAKTLAINSLIATIILAAFFTAFQVYEYLHASFTIADSVYGSTFFMATGFHGFHVFIGTCFLTVCLIRLM